MSTLISVVASVLVLAGVLLFVLAGVGLLRLPDVLARSHAATKPATLGLLLVVAGVALALDDPGDRVKVGLVALFQLVTAPVAAHMVGRAAYRAEPPALVVDELADAREPVDGRD